MTGTVRGCCGAVRAGGAGAPVRMLGIYITVTVAWQRASVGDWAAYAAEVSRRNRASMSSHPDCTRHHDREPSKGTAA
jgi:hypothetical protein